MPKLVSDTTRCTKNIDSGNVVNGFAQLSVSFEPSNETAFLPLIVERVGRLFGVVWAKTLFRALSLHWLTADESSVIVAESAASSHISSPEMLLGLKPPAGLGLKKRGDIGIGMTLLW